MYSQQNEEQYVLAAAERTEAKGMTRRLLDIGAWHATDKSNSRALIERGWSAVLIEPSPGPFVNLMRACTRCPDTPPEPHGERKSVLCERCASVRYGFDSRIELILAAVGIEEGLISLHATDDALSTSDDASYRKWCGGAARPGYDGGFYGQFLTPVLTLRKLFDFYGGDFQFASIDTEGTSVDLLYEMLRIGVHPECICCEHDGRLVEIGNAAAANNYDIVLQNDTNCVLEVKRA